MRIEVLCTGDELLHGLTTDTNSPFFMGKLFALGEQVAKSQTVGDVMAEITGALREVAARADAVLVSGGLGPTADDLTAEAAALAAGVPLVEDAAVLESIQARFAKRGIAFTANNARQARVPKGAEVVPNPVGSAPMFIQRVGRCTLFFVPGVPREYRFLVEREVLPRLLQLIEKQPSRVYRAARLLKTVGLPESHLDEKVQPLARAQPQVMFGFRTHAPENHLKLLAQGGSQAEADEALRQAEQAAREVLGQYVFGADEDELGQVIGELLRQANQTLAIAESCTGGLVSDLLARHPGASAFLVGGAVAYEPTSKVRWAGVDPELLAAHGAVSKEVAEAMATGVRQLLGTTYGLSVTGYAGPTGGTATDPVGTVYCALATPAGVTHQRPFLVGGRARVREFAASAALDMLRRHLLAG